MFMEVERNIIKDGRNLKLEKENKSIKDRTTRHIKNIFEQYEEDYYNPITVGNLYSNSFIEYESNGDRNNILSIKKYGEIKPCLKDVINNIKKFVSWKIQLAIAIKFISSKDMKKSVSYIQKE